MHVDIPLNASFYLSNESQSLLLPFKLPRITFPLPYFTFLLPFERKSNIACWQHLGEHSQSEAGEKPFGGVDTQTTTLSDFTGLKGASYIQDDVFNKSLINCLCSLILAMCQGLCIP